MKIQISLIAKFIFAALIILLLFMGLLDSINLRNFRKQMIEYAAANAEEIAGIISQSAHESMMRNDKVTLSSMIDRVAKSENIDHIRLIDHDGKVVFSSNRDEIGAAIGKHADECVMCHDSPGITSASVNRSRIITTRSGKEALGFTKEIQNRTECFSAPCHFHGKENSVLGVLDISISLENLRHKSHEYRLQFIMLTCLLLLMFGVLLTALVYFLVDVPVQRLVRHTALVASGDLETRVVVTSRDELGELSEAVNSMTESLGQADRDLKGWADSLERKVEERSREIMRMEEQLRRSEKLASIGTLSAGVAHEINNPLTGILLYASLLKDDKRLDPELLPDLEHVISESQRCAGIVKKLLEFSRESIPVIENAYLEDIVEEALPLFLNQPGFYGIEIRKNYSDAVPQVSVDPGQILQVFLNLLINACHAMGNNGVLEITTWLSRDGASVCVSFKDSGEGISEGDLERIFDPFFTTKADGTGLGLSISYGIIQNNGGSIEVQSRKGEGTVFTLSFPVSG